MKDLKKIQRELQEYILKKSDNVIDDLVSPENMPIIGRLDVYRNGYYSRLVEALTGDFPVLCQLMGKNIFDSMARDYLDHNPSRDYSIREIGKSLPDFLSQHKEVHPSYVELAAFEWLLGRAEIAADQAPFTLQALENIPPERWPLLTFLLHVSSYSLSCQYNSIERWEKIRNGEPDIEIVELNQPATILIWRQNTDVQYKTLGATEVVLFSLLQAQLSFSSLCENLARHFTGENDAVDWLSHCLQEWIGLGLLGHVIEARLS